MFTAMLEGEHEREEFYKAIGYSEEEDELEFPKEVSSTCGWIYG